MKINTRRLLAALSAVILLSVAALPALSENVATPPEANCLTALEDGSGDAAQPVEPAGDGEGDTAITGPAETPDEQPEPADEDEPEGEIAPEQTDGPDDESEVQDPETQEPETPALSSYAIVGAGTILYADPQRTTHLGRLTVDTALHVRNVGDYGDAAVYEVIFDTDRTAGTEHYETAYFYTANLRSLTVAQAAALSADRTSESGARVLYADFIYEEADETAAEEGGKTQVPDETEDEAPEGEETTGDETEDEAPEESEEASEPHTNINQVNIRKAPSISSDIVAKLTQGTAITVIETVTNDAGEAWHKVTCAQGNGYIRADLIDGVDSAAAGQDDEETADPVETVDPSEDADPVETVDPAEDADPVETVDPAEDDDLAENADQEEDLTFVPAENDALVAEGDPDEEDLLFIPAENGEETPEDGLEEDDEFAEDEEALAPERSVHLTVNSDTQTLQIGSLITLSAELTGYDDVEYTSCWQSAEADCDGNIIGEWQDVQTDTLSLTYELNEENLLIAWRMSVTVNE